MSTSSVPGNLHALLVELETVSSRPGILSVKELRDTVGRRSFAPLLLLASLLGFTPLGVIPGVPTVLALIIVLVAGQVMIRCHSLWMPNAVLNLSIEKRDLKKAAIALKPFARAVDRVIRPRLHFLTEPPYSFAIAFACILLAITVPPLEFVPLVDMPLWGAMVAFSLALFAHDGVLAIVAFFLIVVGISLSLWALL